MLSGGGRTLLNLCDAIDSGALPARVALVIASRECPGADRARARGLTVRVMPGEIPAPTLAHALRDADARFLILAGYLRRVHLPPEFAGRAINIHPALLPAFGGAGMFGERVHRTVLEAGRRESGCTAHLVTAEYDAGPIVMQRSCPVLEGDTPETLGARVFELERAVYPEAVRALIEGRITVSPDGRRATVRPA